MANRSGVRWRVVDDQFPAIIQGMRAQADLIVAKAAMDVEAQAKVRAPVDTGFLRGSIQARRVGHAHWRVTVGAEYGIFVEYGTARNAPQPYMQPAVQAVRQVFLAAMRKVVP